jgi:AICAR transformylase/IMP cyclohydrolase PurH
MLDDTVKTLSNRIHTMELDHVDKKEKLSNLEKEKSEMKAKLSHIY